MNKTGPQLLELSPKEGVHIQEKYVAADTLYSQIKEDVKKRAVVLDEAISQSTQVILYTRKKLISSRQPIIQSTFLDPLIKCHLQ